MRILALALSVLGGICVVVGIFTAIEILPPFISGTGLAGSYATTTLFFWGLAALFLLGSIAVSLCCSSEQY